MIHGLDEMRRANAGPDKVFWVLGITLAAVVCSVLVMKISGSFFLDESVMSVNIALPSGLPVMYFCPKVIAIPAAVQAAGYPIEVAKFVQSVFWTGSSDRIYNKSEPDLNRNVAELSSLTKDDFQTMLLKIGRKHMELLELTIDFRKYGLLHWKTSLNVQLVSFGYCFVAQADPGEMSISQVNYAKFMGYIGYDDCCSPEAITHLKESGGLSFTYSQDNLTIIPRDGPYLTLHVSVYQVIPTHLKRRGNGGRAYRETKGHYQHCLQGCVTRGAKCNDCRIYDPTGKQKLSEICPFNKMCAKKALANSHECQARCEKERDLTTYALTNTVVDAEDTQLANRYFVAIYIRNAPGLVSIVEQRAVSFGAFGGYTGGTMGTCLGFNLVMFFATVWSLVKPGIKTSIRCAEYTRKVGKVAPWIISLALLFTMLPDVCTDYFTNKTSGRIKAVKVSTNNKFPNIVIGTEWIDRKKLEILVPWTNSLEEQGINELFLHGVSVIPPVCAVIDSTMIGTTYRTFQNNNTALFPAEFHSRYRKVLSKLSQTLAERNLDYIDLLDQISHNPYDQLIDRVYTEGGTNLNYSVSRASFSFMGPYYEITIDPDSANEFSQDLGPIHVDLHKKPEDKVCAKDRVGRRALLLTYSAEVTLAGGFLEENNLFASSDYILDMAPYTTERKSTPNKPCKADTNYHECLWSCLDIHQSECACDIFLPDFPSRVRGLKNVSQLCSYFMGSFNNCLFLTLLLKPAVVAECERTCTPACRREYVSLQLAAKPQESSNIQKLALKIRGNMWGTEVVEFYAYDASSFCCSAAALVALCFGFSFITVTKPLLSAVYL